MSNYHIGRRSPMLCQTINQSEADAQHQIRYHVEEAKAESHMWRQYENEVHNWSKQAFDDCDE